MIEDVLETIRKVLTVSLDGEIDKQNIKYANDGRALKTDYIKEILVGSEVRNGMPFIRLVANTESQGLMATGYKDVDYDISVEVLVTDSNEDRAERLLYRSMRAIECVLEKFLPGKDSIINYTTNGKDYHAPVHQIDEVKSTEKGGIIAAIVRERVESYRETQT